jgi:hypothetical protein
LRLNVVPKRSRTALAVEIIHRQACGSSEPIAAG